MQEICKIYAGICNICNHEFYMQNMQEYALPTLLMLTELGRRHQGAAGLRHRGSCYGRYPNIHC
jgi:hypothetical protein